MTSQVDRHEALQRICREFGVAILYVFGSRAIGDAYRRWVKQHPDKMEQA